MTTYSRSSMVLSLHRFDGESNVNISPTTINCWVGVNPATPALVSPSVKNPPSFPRESSIRYSSRTTAFAHRYGFRYSSVAVMAFTDCSYDVQRPALSQAISGRTDTLHGPCEVQRTGSWAD